MPGNRKLPTAPCRVHGSKLDNGESSNKKESMKDDLQEEHLRSIIVGLRKDIETLQKLRKEDADRLKQWQEDAAFGRRCRFYVEAMAELRSHEMPGFIDMAAPILIRMLNSVAPPEDLGAKEAAQ